MSHDPNLEHVVQCADGRPRTAIDMQYAIADAVTRWLEGASEDPTAGEGELILREWGEVLDGLSSDPATVADRVDWVAKKRLVDAIAERDGLPSDHMRLRAVDLQYHDMRADKCLASRVGLRSLVPEESLLAAISSPPGSTRAWFRGECIRRWPERVASANWDGIVFDVGGPSLIRVPMMDPLKGTERLMGDVLSGARDVEDLLRRLGVDAVEEVHGDPGW